MDYEVLLKNSWNIVKDNIVTFIVGLLIAVIGSILIVTIAPLAYGYTFMAIKGVRGEIPEIGDVFEGFKKDNFIRSWTYMLIAIVASVIIGQIPYLSSILSLIMGVLLMYTMPLLIIRGYGGIDGITESIEMVQAVPIESVIIYVIINVLIFIGMLLIGIGVLITAPIAAVFIAGATTELAGER
ncbi:hypothetical protein [Methanolobus sp. WCC4]|uniref:hypothetical protein n=1 Tax=Methanolobus sp. WCC4 TaxID=3125784 RepID=UPI0030F651BE